MRALAWLAGLPGPRLRAWIARRAAARECRRNGGVARITACNLRLTGLDPALREATVAQTMLTFLESLRFWSRPAARNLALVAAVEGLEHLEALRAQGRGVLLVSAHFVHLELCARLLTRHVAVAGMYRPHGDAAMEWAVKAGRLRYACAMFARDELRPALDRPLPPGPLWFAPDQESRRGDSVFVPFFGQPAWSLTSTHQLARLSGAAVCPFFHERLADGSYRLEVQAPLAGAPSKDATADTTRVMAALEAMIRRAPSQYLWLHQRFKTQPDGERGEAYREA